MADSTQPQPNLLQRYPGRALALVGALALLAFLWIRSSGEVPVPVRAATISHANITSVISTNGKVETVDNFEAHAPNNTTVRRLLVQEGDRVKAGQLLMELDVADAQAALARAVAQLKSAEAEASAVHQGGTQEEVFVTRAQFTKTTAERETAAKNLEALKRLQQQGAASAGEVREAESNLARLDTDLNLLGHKKKDRFAAGDLERADAQASEARANYAAANEALAKCIIRAPREGVVYQVAAKQGAFVNSGDLLLQQAPLKQMLVRAFIDEPDLGRLSTGQPVNITWDALPGRKWQGKLAALPSVVKLRGSRNVGEIAVQVENADLQLLPNVNVTVTVVTAQHDNVMVLPREAMRQDDGVRYVYVIQNGTLSRHNVQTGLSNLTQYELTEGLDPGSRVALGSTNNKPLHNGLKVQVVE